MKKKPKNIKKIIALILFSFHPLVFIYLAKIIPMPILSVLIAALLSIFFMVVTHELGHLIFGRLTGYQFISFRIFSLMLFRENGKWKLKRHKVPGTAGQCLMAPPRKQDGKYPYKLYNLGGILFCGVLSFIPMVISMFLIEHPLGMPLFVFGFVSFFMNLMNAIPTNGKSMLNDATNLRMANRSEAGKDALWNQLEYMRLYAQNVRTADMPAEMFFRPQESELGNTLVQWQSVANTERYEDMGDYAKAWEEAIYLLEKAPFLPNGHKDILKTEIVYLGALLGNDAARIGTYYKELERYAPVSFRRSVQFKRMVYAYQKFVEKDESAANLNRKTLEARIEKEAYAASRNFERRQMEYIDHLTAS